MLVNYHATKDFANSIENTDYLVESGFPVCSHDNLRIIAGLINSEDLKVFIIDEKIKKLLFQTKNDIYPRPPPFLELFLETNIDTETLNVFGLTIFVSSSNDETLIKSGNYNFEENIEKNTKEMDKFFESKGVSHTQDGKIDMSKLPNKLLMKLLAEFQQYLSDKGKRYFENLDKDEIKKTHEEFKKLVVEDVAQNKFRIYFFIWGFDKKDKTIFYGYDCICFSDENSSIHKFQGDMGRIKRETEDRLTGIDFEFDTIDSLKDNLKLFICNLLDFINNPEVQIVPFKENKERNLKRLKREKPPIPEYRIIKVNGELKRYMEEAEQKRFFEYSHKFWVRGHFKRYWNKDRYRLLYKKFKEDSLSSRYYLDKKYDVLMRWVVPYVKGKGILTNNIYNIKKKNE